jgi:GTP-binding protein Era
LTRAGIVALAGRPNVGKSTLVNAMVGAKVAIVSSRPQTTRRAIKGVLSTPDTQLVLVDLPGVQHPRDALTSRMAARVQAELHGCDQALLVLDGREAIGPTDRAIAATLQAAGALLTVAVNKVDVLDRAHTLQALTAASALVPAGDVFPVSARTGSNVAALVEHLRSHLPAGPFMFDANTRSDQPLDIELAELVREAILKRTFHEVPHAVEVVVDSIDDSNPSLTRITALVWVETSSQKGILIGAAGRMIKAIGIAARRELERELSTHVHLELTVKVKRDWRKDDAMIDRLGIG